MLAILGDMVTTDHISPAGSFKETTPAGQYLIERQVPPREFNSYGSRRGNHEVMMRGTFANIRIRNEMLDGVEGGYTNGPDGKQTSIYDAAMAWQEQGMPLVIFAGEQYGAGSSRDWAAKGTALLGVKAVIAESFERIHRSNLVGMGVIPFEFTGGDTRKSLDLSGDEEVTINGLADVKPLADRARRRSATLTAPRRRSTSSAASIPRSRSNTSRTAACCTTCCATSPRRPDGTGPVGHDRPRCPMPGSAPISVEFRGLLLRGFGHRRPDLALEHILRDRPRVAQDHPPLAVDHEGLGHAVDAPVDRRCGRYRRPQGRRRGCPARPGTPARPSASSL